VISVGKAAGAGGGQFKLSCNSDRSAGFPSSENSQQTSGKAKANAGFGGGNSPTSPLPQKLSSVASRAYPR